MLFCWLLGFIYFLYFLLSFISAASYSQPHYSILSYHVCRNKCVYLCYQHLNMCDGPDVSCHGSAGFISASHGVCRCHGVTKQAAVHLYKCSNTNFKIKLCCLSQMTLFRNKKTIKYRPPGQQQVKRQVIPRVFVGRNVA
jgi:hypothetical protein